MEQLAREAIEWIINDHKFSRGYMTQEIQSLERTLIERKKQYDELNERLHALYRLMGREGAA